MYPEINSLIDELHKRHISTFLVTNAQFPDRIKALKPITQLYVSIDAATKESLKVIDRPLFGDFWERFVLSTYQEYKTENDADIDYRSIYSREEYMDGEDGELSWFNAGVRVGVGIGLGICLGLGLGVGVLVRTYQATTRNFKRRLI